jgi:hypothetical protein
MQLILLIKEKTAIYTPYNRIWRVTCALYLWLCLAACDPPPPTTYTVTIKVQDDESVPLAGARVAAGSEASGITESSGILYLKLKGEEGDTRSITVKCPNGYRTGGETRSVVLRTFSGLGNKQTTNGPELSWQCLPTERLAALVVRAPGQSDLAVRLYGKEIARTSPDGTAHALLRLAPGSTLHVALDTSTRPELRPQSPEKTFHVEDQDTILIFDQQFTEFRPPPVRVRVHRKPAEPQRIIPYRIQ